MKLDRTKIICSTFHNANCFKAALQIKYIIENVVKVL